MMMMRKVSRRDWWFGEHTDDKHYTLGHLGKTVKFTDRYLLAHFEHFASYRAAVTVVVGARCHASRLSVWVTAGDDAAGVSAVFVDTVIDLHSGRRTSCDLSCSLPLLGNLVSRTCGLSPAVDASWSSIMPVSLWRIADSPLFNLCCAAAWSTHLGAQMVRLVDQLTFLLQQNWRSQMTRLCARTPLMYC